MCEKILVSACLLGINCRWHGKKCSISRYVKKYIKNNPDIEIIPVCPEILGGMLTPRQPVKRLNGHVYITCPDKKLRKNVTGKDVTKYFKLGAEETLKIAIKNKIKLAILCQWSPSCDKTGITGKLLNENRIEIINTF